MTQYIMLDASPLGLIAQRPGLIKADACRAWAAAHDRAGRKLFVPEIIDFEVRRELVRINATAALSRLEAFIAAEPGRYLPITTAAMREAALVWADARRRGIPTADPKELDVDVVLAAQVRMSVYPRTDTIVATGNVTHLRRFVTAELWSAI